MSGVKPGDIIVTENQAFRDDHVVCRIVKIGKVMWEVETYRSHRGRWEFDRPSRRKVGAFKVYRGNDLDGLAEIVMQVREAFWQDQKERRDRYYRDVTSLPGLEAPE